MSDLETAARILVLPTEEVKVVLDGELEVVSTAGTGTGTQDNTQPRRLLAVISHRDDADGHEEGSLFVFRPVFDSANELEIQTTLPIIESFSVSTAQSRRQTLDLRASPLISVLDQPRSGFTLTINSGQENSFTFVTTDVQHLRSVLDECKRLKELHVATLSYSPSTTHQWLAPYKLRREVSPRLSSIPPNLRDVINPLHMRLSQASAGLPGDDERDIILVRDEWIRVKSRDIHRKSSSISIRTGTFNVNGKLPSQDLSTWVRGSSHARLGRFPGIADSLSGEAVTFTTAHTLPPLNSISPFAVKEITSDPFEQASKDALASQTSVTTVSSTTTTNINKTSLPGPNISNEDPDLLVFAFQELDLSTEALLYSTSTAKEDAWCVAIFAALGEKSVAYVKLASKQLVGILLVMIVKKELAPCFSDIQACAMGVGIMGVMGNKGGTAIRVKYTPPPANDMPKPHTTVLTFVNSHLAAFDEMVDKRNADFQYLSRRLLFDTAEDAAAAIPLVIGVYDSDALFWMVRFSFLNDLNYRLDLPDADVRGILASEHWDNPYEALLQHDQLKGAIASGKAFEGFSEYPITHLPSYRFSPGVVTDELGYDIKRKPAWTDRVLHIAGPALRVQQRSYAAHPEITMSDHRAVSADFSVEVDVYDEAEYEAAVRQLYRSVASLEEEDGRRSIQVTDPAIDLGAISYKRAVARTVKIKNTGKIPCVYRFVSSSAEAPIHPDWLRVEPMTGLLLPDEEAPIQLTAFVDNEAASRLNLGPRAIDCTLILHIGLGKDSFVSVTASYEHTCFANKLSRLMRLPGPIRSLSSPDELLPEDRAISAPREVMRLVNWLMSNTEHAAGLFAAHVDEEVVGQIRECLDTGAEFPFPPVAKDPNIVSAFGQTLLRLLDSLTEPVVPGALHSRCAQVTSRDEAFELLDAFPSTSVNVWISVTAFLHFICQPHVGEVAPNSAERIATIFAPILLRDKIRSSSAPVSLLGKRNFVLYFIGQ